MAKTPLKKAGPAADEEAPKRTVKGGGGGASKADLFDNAKPQEGFGVPQGQYEAIIVGAELQGDEKTQKESIMLEYEIINARDEELNGKTLKAWYNLIDANGEAAKGLGFWKRDAAIIGYECAYDELEETLEQLVNDRIEVAVTVKINGQYTNVYLNGLSDN